MRQNPTPIKDTTPYVLDAPVGIDRIVKVLQSKLASDLPWLEKSFNRAVIMSNIDPKDNESVFPKCWVNDGQDEFDMIANDNWAAYSFFVSTGEETPLDYMIDESSQYQRELSLFFWFNLEEIYATKTYDYTEELKQEILSVLRDSVFTKDDAIEVTAIINNALDIYSEFTISPTKTQLLYYPYSGVRIDLIGTYRDLDACDIQLAAPSNFVFSNPTTETLDADITSNSGGQENGFAWYISVDGISFTQAGTTGSGVTTFQYGSLLEETLYYGKAKALGVVNSAFSNTDTASTSENLFDPWAQTYFDRIDANGIPLDDTTKGFINTYALAERAAGNIDLYDEFYLLVLGDTNSLIGAQSKIATAFGGITFDINGAVFNGVNAYIDSDFVPISDGSNYAVNDALIGTFVNDVGTLTTGYEYLIGAFGTSESGISTRSTSQRLRINGLAQTQGGSPIASDNLVAHVRTGLNAQEVFINGVSDLTSLNISTGLPSESFFIGAINNGGTATNYADSTISSVLISAGVGFDQVAHNTNLRNLLTELGT